MQKALQTAVQKVLQKLLQKMLQKAMEEATQKATQMQRKRQCKGVQKTLQTKCDKYIAGMQKTPPTHRHSVIHLINLLVSCVPARYTVDTAELCSMVHHSIA